MTIKTISHTKTSTYLGLAIATAGFAVAAAFLIVQITRPTKEKMISLEGTIEIEEAHITLPDGTSKIIRAYLLKSTNGSKKTLLKDVQNISKNSLLKKGDVVRVSGIMEKSWIDSTKLDITSHADVIAGSSTTLDLRLPPIDTSNTSHRKLAVILFNMTDYPVQPYTTQDVRSQLFGSNADSLANFINESSYNKFHIDGDVFGWYTVPHQINDDCNTFGSDRMDAWEQDAIDRAKTDGLNLSEYSYFAFSWVMPPKCGRFGNGGGNIIQLHGQTFQFSVLKHEFGHLLLFNHANTLTCTAENGERVSISNHCHSDEYNDGSDIMGYADDAGMEYNGFDRALAGWLPEENITTLNKNNNNITETYRLTLRPIEAYPIPGTTQLIRVPFPHPSPVGAADQSLYYYYLEYHQPIGLDANALPGSSPFFNGITIKVAPDFHNPGGDTHSHLINTDKSGAGFGQSPLPVGSLFEDAPDYQIHIRTISISPDGAIVEITLGTLGKIPRKVFHQMAH